MSFRKKNLVYIGIILLIYGLLLFSIVSPENFLKVFVGPSPQEEKVIVFTLSSEFQSQATKIRILLPDNLVQERSYPVLYILPTRPDRWDFWWDSPILEAVKYDIANKYQVICVAISLEKMPWFADHPTNPLIRQESFILKKVIPYIDHRYPTIAEKSGRYLLGFSKSGWGAFSLLLRNPDMFHKAASWDAPMMFDTLDVWGSGLSENFGTRENFKKYHIPTLLSRDANTYQKEDRFVLMGYSHKSDHVQKVHILMNNLGVQHTYDNTEKRRHSWHSGWFMQAVEYLLLNRG